MVDGRLNKIRVGAIIQARMKSERLPGKILMPLPFPDGKPLLSWVISSCKRSTFIDEVIVASSDGEENDVLVPFCEQASVHLFRGDENDVLGRFIAVSRAHKLDVVVRLTGDNPLIDVNVLDRAINAHVTSANDYTITTGLPLGMNLEVVSSNALRSIASYDLTNDHKEHVTLFFKNNPKYKTESIKINEYPELRNIRLTVDYPSDMAVVSHVLFLLGKDEKVSLSWLNKIFKDHRWIFSVNASNQQRLQVLSDKDDILFGISLLENNGLNHSAHILKRHGHV
jgi:spore coat polysaccharide biosynthesis protein SpsF